MKHQFFQPVEAASECFLIEALYWRAFGRIPPTSIDAHGEDWRSNETRESLSAELPYEDYVDVGEARFAGIDPDPRGPELENGVGYLEPASIKRLKLIFETQGAEPEVLERIGKDLIAHEEYCSKLEAWKAQLEAYLEEFKAELFLALRRSKIQAFGCLVNAENYENEHELDDLVSSQSVPIDPKVWNANGINWEASSLKRDEHEYVWIKLATSKLMELFPPELVLESHESKHLGLVYVAHQGLSSQFSKSRRGRKPYNWEPFYVEVSRLYLAREMPQKKEAAIQYFIDWFKSEYGKRVGRSTIGEKLTPFFRSLPPSEIEY